MEPRLILAYALIALMILSAAGTIAYARHNSRERKAARQHVRETAALLERQQR